MPIFHDPDDPLFHQPSKQEEANEDARMRKVSEESIRTEFCEGPLLENSLPSERETPDPVPTSPSVSDRLELIERIKRGESPTWVPNKLVGLQDIPSLRVGTGILTFLVCQLEPRIQFGQLERQFDLRDAPLSGKPSLNTLDDQDVEASHNGYISGLLNSPAEIERPRSALHAGDFTEKDSRTSSLVCQESEARPSSGNIHASPPATPWYQPLGKDRSSTEDSFYATRPKRYVEQDTRRSRAPSLSSYSSSFVLKAPTSPLVQTSTNEDLDFSPTSDSFNLSSVNSQSARRHTLPHRISSISSFSAAPVAAVPNFSKPLPSVRRENTFPYQAHQPRRSITTALGSHPSTSPRVGTRPPSFSSDASPLHHAPMVGSYEESILRGRMSTTPSKPLDFMAQIGVLGLGKCKSSLRCPAHVSVPFPAVFYSYGNTSVGRTIANDGPSPYVGLIDIENTLESGQDSREEKRRRRRVSSSPAFDGENAGMDIPESMQENGDVSDFDRRKREKKLRRLTTPRAPPDGSYRIPQRGQIQIIIKNPNKTAVKLFLIPYDLEGMETGTKTFIRQRSYSTGPILEQPLSSGTGTEQSEDATRKQTLLNSNDRPTLRYLIHLHICCPSRGRFYLYKSIRVVFANRVPDGKEKLRNEIQLPEPRYSTYKPSRDSQPTLPFSMGNALAAQKAYRRRSSGFALSPGRYDTLDGIGSALNATFRGTSSLPYHQLSSPPPPIQPIPFSLADLTRHSQSQQLNREISTKMEIDSASSPSSQSQNAASSLRSPPDLRTWNTDHCDGGSNGTYDKLRKEDVGYGGQAFEMGRCGKADASEGLLAQRLRGLDVHRAKDVDAGSKW